MLCSKIIKIVVVTFYLINFIRLLCCIETLLSEQKSLFLRNEYKMRSVDERIDAVVVKDYIDSSLIPRTTV